MDILNEQIANDLRKLFFDIPQQKFNSMLRSIDNKAEDYTRHQKWYASKLNLNNSDHLKRVQEFQRHASALVKWLRENEDNDALVFNGQLVLDGVKSNRAEMINIVEPNTVIASMLEWELGNATSVIDILHEEIKAKQRAKKFPTAPRYIFIQDLAHIYDCYNCGNPWMDTSHNDINPPIDAVRGNWDERYDAYYGKFLTMVWMLCKSVQIHLSVASLHDYIKRCLALNYNPSWAGLEEP